jgi:hypothetical protein
MLDVNTQPPCTFSPIRSAAPAADSRQGDVDGLYAVQRQRLISGDASHSQLTIFDMNCAALLVLQHWQPVM